MSRIDELQSDIENAERQISANQQIIAFENQKGPEKNVSIISNSQEIIRGLQADVDRAKLAIQGINEADQRETAVQTAISDFAGKLDGLTFTGEGGKQVGVRELFAGEAHYQLLRIWMQTQFEALAEDGKQQVANVQAAHQEQLKAAAEREAQLQRQNQQLATERDDLSANRDNAAAQLSEAKVEIEQLNGHIVDLNAQIALGVRGAIAVVTPEDRKKEMDTLIKTIDDSRIRVTNMRYKDEIAKRSFLAERADTGETIEIPWMEKTKYIDLSPEEVSQFRATLENHPLDGIPTTIDAPPLDATVERFPTGNDMDGKSAPVGTEADGDDSRITERLAALELAVFGQVRAA